MRIWLVLLAVAGVLVAPVGAARASECPALIEEARAVLAQARRNDAPGPLKDAKLAAAEIKLRNAQAAHDAEQHAIAVREANEVLRSLRPAAAR